MKNTVIAFIILVIGMFSVSCTNEGSDLVENYCFDAIKFEDRMEKQITNPIDHISCTLYNINGEKIEYGSKQNCVNGYINVEIALNSYGNTSECLRVILFSDGIPLESTINGNKNYAHLIDIEDNIRISVGADGKRAAKSSYSFITILFTLDADESIDYSSDYVENNSFSFDFFANNSSFEKVTAKRVADAASRPICDFYSNALLERIESYVSNYSLYTFVSDDAFANEFEYGSLLDVVYLYDMDSNDTYFNAYGANGKYRTTMFVDGTPYKGFDGNASVEYNIDTSKITQIKINLEDDIEYNSAIEFITIRISEGEQKQFVQSSYVSTKYLYLPLNYKGASLSEVVRSSDGTILGNHYMSNGIVEYDGDEVNLTFDISQIANRSICYSLFVTVDGVPQSIEVDGKDHYSYIYELEYTQSKSINFKLNPIRGKNNFTIEVYNLPDVANKSLVHNTLNSCVIKVPYHTSNITGIEEGVDIYEATSSDEQVYSQGFSFIQEGTTCEDLRNDGVLIDKDIPGKFIYYNTKYTEGRYAVYMVEDGNLRLWDDNSYFRLTNVSKDGYLKIEYPVNNFDDEQTCWFIIVAPLDGGNGDETSRAQLSLINRKFVSTQSGVVSYELPNADGTHGGYNVYYEPQLNGSHFVSYICESFYPEDLLKMADEEITTLPRVRAAYYFDSGRMLLFSNSEIKPWYGTLSDACIAEDGSLWYSLYSISYPN